MGYVLGLDIGSNSIGWAVVDESNAFVRSGVRIFPDGTKKEKSGESSRATDRRSARLMRRQLGRRKLRMRHLRSVLLGAGMLPAPGSPQFAELAAMDPYELRALAVRDRLELHEIGRALLHLARRRGFKSNAKEGGKEAELEEQAAAAFRKRLGDSPAESIGQYLNLLREGGELTRRRTLPEPPKAKRVKGEEAPLEEPPVLPLALRKDVEAEFGKIWDRQRVHHRDVLTEGLKRRVYEAIFHQRPLKPKDHLIGKCPYLDGERRAPRAAWLAQEVRLLQEVNNLEINQFDGRTLLLNEAQRHTIVERLRKSKEVTFDALRKLPILEMGDGDRFNLESTHRLKLKGHPVEAGLMSLFKARWQKDANLLRHQLWNCYVDADDDEAFCKALEENGWDLWPDGDEEERPRVLKGLGKVYRDAGGEGYAKLSLAAMERIHPHLENGLRFYDATIKEFGEKTESEVVAKLPPIKADDINNPVVTRCLSEMRKVVNAIIHEHGKPDRIIVELARSARGTIDQRAEIEKEIKKNTEKREKARAELDRAGIPTTRENVRKFLLWDEQGRRCAYTGNGIALEALYGDDNAYDIDHIIPYSRCYEDGMANLVLCERDANRQKGKRTPFEWLGTSDPAAYQEMLERLDRLGMPFGKKKRFRMETIPDQFRNRQLTDTSYASRLAREQLAFLGVPVSSVKGALVADMRYVLGLNKVLRSGEGSDLDSVKNRGDHRHHAVDAIVIALNPEGRRNALARAKTGEGEMEQPWTSFVADTKKAIDAIIVSHRPDHKLNKAFNKDTNYGRITHPEKGAEGFVTRKMIDSFKKVEDLGKIVDKGVREAILAHVMDQGHDVSNPKAEFPKGWFVGLRMRAKSGLGPVIRHVRVFEGKKSGAVDLGKNGTPRIVEMDDNHHIAFYKDGDGCVARVGRRLEAMQRKWRGEPIVPKFLDGDPEKPLLLWLMKGDMVRFRCEEGEGIYVVSTLSGPPDAVLDMELKSHTDGLSSEERKPLRNKRPFGVRIRNTRDVVMRGNMMVKKVQVGPLGRVSPLNDA